MSKKLLTAVFKAGVDGANSNAYYVPCKRLELYLTSIGDKKIKLSTLCQVLGELSDKWDKEIDKCLNTEADYRQNN
jgi:hypothetical protein